MPDIPNRTDEERAMAAILLAIFDEKMQQAVWLIGNSSSTLPASFYSGLASDVMQAVQPQLAGLHLEAGQRMAESVGQQLDPARAASEAEAWARKQAEQMARDLAERIQKQVDEILAEQAAGEADVAGVALSLEGVFSEGRADVLATDLTTGAASAGEIGAGRTIEKETGLVLEAIWRIDDSGACEVCYPLDGQSIEVWGDQFPSGPGAHPNCRCYLVWQPKLPW
jgi:hypothetical protein